MTERTPILTEEQVANILPQGDNFRFVGDVLELEPGKRVVAKMLDLRKPELMYIIQSHFGIIPGSIILEALEQACSIAVSAIEEGKIGVVTGVDGLRLRKTVRPDDEVLLEAEIIRMRSNAGWARVNATVDGKKVAGGKIMFGIVDKESLSQ